MAARTCLFRVTCATRPQKSNESERSLLPNVRDNVPHFLEIAWTVNECATENRKVDKMV